MGNKKSTLNTIELAGVLVSKDLEDKNFDDKREGHEGEQYQALAGTITLRTKDGSEHELRLFTKMYKANGEISSMYESYAKIRDEYVALTEANAELGIMPTYLKVGQCGFGANIGISKSTGKATVFNQIEGKFFNVMDSNEIELAENTAKFKISGVVDSIKPYISKGVDTGDLIVTINTINYYASKLPDGTERDNSKLVPVNLRVDKSLANIFKATYKVGQFAKFWGECINLKTESEVEVVAGFGESTTDKVVTYDVRNVIKGGTTAQTASISLTEIGYTQAEYEQLKSKFELEKAKKENGGNALVNTNVNQEVGVNPTQQTDTTFNPFAGA